MKKDTAFKNTEDFDDLFRTYYPQLCRYSFSIIGDLNASEDIIQDVFVKYWSKKDQLTINFSLKSYLYRSVHNASLNFLRNQKSKAKHEENFKQWNTKFELENTVVEKELEEKIKMEISKLPERTKAIFVLSRDEHLKYKEIADTLNISIKTVEAHISKALKVLTLELQEYLPLLLMLYSLI